MGVVVELSMDRQQAGAGDGDTGVYTAEVVDPMAGTTERLLGVDDPGLPIEPIEQSIEDDRMSEVRRGAYEPKPSSLIQPAKSGEELAPGTRRRGP